ncbi:hypothetical protein CTI12_AA456800 [Artemisia annua]|uniref:Uncharacterized protein n=1 Tax=Artemisia annua TaxID=35608 RepID=A0A2U1LT82_ARTAN|nr:hypothetical protein CTI12_AA456800 [Artemisia annua]
MVRHCCDPKAFANDGKLCIPSCCPSTKFCNGGGQLRLRQLNRNTRIWSCYEDSDFDQSLWARNYQNSTNSEEEIDWTCHFCKPALMIENRITQAWPTCDPSRKKCNGGELIHGDVAKRYEWACFNESKRSEIGYHGISFGNWVKVRFGETQLSTKDEMYHCNEWAKANFLGRNRLKLVQYVAPTVWDRPNASKDKESGILARLPT